MSSAGRMYSADASIKSASVHVLKWQLWGQVVTWPCKAATLCWESHRMSVEDGTALLQSPIHLLHRAGQCVGFIFSDEVHGGDLTPRQYTILAAVAREEGLSQTDLVTRTGIDRSTLADIIRRLVQKGWIQRRRTSADARVYAIRLTEEGREVLR